MRRQLPRQWLIAALLLPAATLADCPPPATKPASMMYCYVPVATWGPRVVEVFSTGKPKFTQGPRSQRIGMFLTKEDAQCFLDDYLKKQPPDTTGHVHIAALGASSWCD